MNTPFFCITSDTDWASEYCLQDFTSILNDHGIKPTIFVTHDSPIIKKLLKDDVIEVGIHPNFFPNSTQGDDHNDILNNLLKLYPDSKSFRSHSFFENSHILMEMRKRELNYDSNLCLYLQPNLVPLSLATGGVRFPVFCEDDAHWNSAKHTWDFDDYLATFMTPGLKVLNFHAFLVTANIPNLEYYEKIKEHSPTLSEENIEEIRYEGKGVRTFFIELLQKLTSTERFHTLRELYELFPIEDFMFKQNETEGRTTIHTDTDYEDYWSMTETDRQNFLKESYGKRDAKDPYATSRDFNLRELEIELIKKLIDKEGDILDLGCGNGYTLISLANQLKNCKMTGVDFSSNLIEGANHILNERKSELKSIPDFINADAIEFLNSEKEESYDYIITERFIQNLPSEKTQQDVLSNIHRILKPGGKLLMCEGSEDGFDQLNKIRAKVGLETTPATSKDNVSAIRIKDNEFEDIAKNLGFIEDEKYGFSNYFLISRVLHPLYVKPQNPRFDSKLNEFARIIQENSPFDTGFGSNALWVLSKEK